MPGDIGEEVLSPWVGYYEDTTPESHPWMEDERFVDPKNRKKSQNKLANAVIFRYLKSQKEL